MNISKKFLASSVLLALASTSAMAIDPGSLSGTQTILRIGGATATDNSLVQLMALDPADPEVGSRAPCQAGSVDVYRRGNDFAISCLSSANIAGLTAGTQIVVNKETAGGSANGISPVKQQTTLLFIDFTAANIVANCTAAPVNRGGTNGIQTYEDRTCATTLPQVSAAPHVGISDVDPLSFVGAGGVTLADAQGLPNKARGVQVLFAPIVSEPLYARLQTLQGLANNNALANMPSLPSPVLRAIFTGGVIDWDQVYVKNKTTGVMSRVGDGAGGFPTYLCRRGDSSGTMTSFKIHFLGENCAKNPGIGAFSAPDQGSCTDKGCGWNADLGAGANTFGDDFIFAGAGSGDVRNCVSFGTISSTGTARNEYRIGVLSTERKPATTGNSDRFRYVRVDDQEPTLVAAQEGRYDFFTENTLNDRGVALGGGLDQIWTHIKNEISNRAAVAAANGAFTDAASPGVATGGAADTGVLVAPIPGTLQPVFPIVAANVRSQLAANGGPVNSQSRTYAGAPINNCNQTFQAVP